jgi:5-hydroxyisourate hydrolase
MGKLTTHVLDIAAGIPAKGMRIELHEVTTDRVLIKSVHTNDDGRTSEPLLAADTMRVGKFTLTFHVADHFRSVGIKLADPPFLDQVVVAFGIAHTDQSYHVPLLVSPWSYSTYRGS